MPRFESAGSLLVSPETIPQVRLGMDSTLAEVMRHVETKDWQKHFAAEALGLAVAVPFLLDPQPVQKALAWLDQHLPR